MNEQNLNTIDSISAKPEIDKNEQAHPNSLGKFAVVFMLGVTLFALFLLFTGKSPFFPVKSNNTQIKNAKMDKPYSQEFTTEEIVQEDETKETTTVTDEIMTEIDSIKSTEVTTTYNENQLEDLR